MQKLSILINDYNVPATALNLAIKLTVPNEAILFGLFAQSPKYSDDSYLFPGGINFTEKDLSTAGVEDEHLQFFLHLYKVMC